MIPSSRVLSVPSVTDGHWIVETNTPMLLEIRGKVELFDSNESPSERVVRLYENSELIYRSFRSKQAASKIRFEVVWNAKLVVRAGFFGLADAPITSVIETVITASGVRADIEILGLAFEGASLDIDGILTIENGCKEVVASIHETNVFLGETGMIRGVPSLKVRSDDVKASHSCTIERLSDEHRFYLEWRGLSEQDAQITLLDGKINHLYEGLSEEAIGAIRTVFLDCFSHA